MAADRTKQSTWEDAPGVWFSVLCNALADHDFGRAAEAHERLERLGVVVRFRHLHSIGHRGDSQLSSKLIRRTQLTIHQLLQFVLVCRLLAKGDRSHIISPCIKLMHGLKQSMVLVFSWCQLQEHRLFHRTSILRIEKSVNRQVETQPLAPIRNAPFLSRLTRTGHPGAVLVR